MLEKVVITRRVPTAVLFFAEASPLAVATALDEIAEPVQFSSHDPIQWFFPVSDNWRVLCRFQPEILQTYSDLHRDAVTAAVGRDPLSILELTLHWRLLDEARDAATTLATHLLSQFYGVADDRTGDNSIWTIEEIRASRNGLKFMEKADITEERKQSSDDK